MAAISYQLFIVCRRKAEGEAWNPVYTQSRRGSAKVPEPLLSRRARLHFSSYRGFTRRMIQVSPPVNLLLYFLAVSS